MEPHLTGDTDREYLLEATTDFREWWVLSTNTIWDSPMVEAAAGAFDHRFYRVRER